MLPTAKTTNKLHINKGYQFLDKVWLSPKARNNDVIKNLKFFERVSLWVVDTLLGQPTVEQRASLMAHFIKISQVPYLTVYQYLLSSQALLDLNNYAGAVAVITGLGLPPMVSLYKTKACVSENYPEEKVPFPLIAHTTLNLIPLRLG